jgi:hypothetical protein
MIRSLVNDSLSSHIGIKLTKPSDTTKKQEPSHRPVPRPAFSNENKPEDTPGLRQKAEKMFVADGGLADASRLNPRGPSTRPSNDPHREQHGGGDMYRPMVADGRYLPYIGHAQFRPPAPYMQAPRDITGYSAGPPSHHYQEMHRSNDTGNPFAYRNIPYAAAPQIHGYQGPDTTPGPYRGYVDVHHPIRQQNIYREHGQHDYIHPQDTRTFYDVPHQMSRPLRHPQDGPHRATSRSPLPDDTNADEVLADTL